MMEMFCIFRGLELIGGNEGGLKVDEEAEVDQLSIKW